jgi:hypothetical protein
MRKKTGNHCVAKSSCGSRILRIQEGKLQAHLPFWGKLTRWAPAMMVRYSRRGPTLGFERNMRTCPVMARDKAQAAAPEGRKCRSTGQADAPSH